MGSFFTDLPLSFFFLSAGCSSGESSPVKSTIASEIARFPRSDRVERCFEVELTDGAKNEEMVACPLCGLEEAGGRDLDVDGETIMVLRRNCKSTEVERVSVQY